jgi:hypothetical protein
MLEEPVEPDVPALGELLEPEELLAPGEPVLVPAPPEVD